MVDPAVNCPAGRAGVEYQVAAGRVGTEEPVEESVAGVHLVENAQLPARGRRVLGHENGRRPTWPFRVGDDGCGQCQAVWAEHYIVDLAAWLQFECGQRQEQAAV